jgi:DNA-binding transcriptional LysR family regulator
MKFSLDQIRHVAALDQQRHFGRAAEMLGITQPALSRSILALERRVGGRLFERSRSGVTPTALGLRFLEHGRDVLRSAARLEEHLDASEGRASLELNLAAGLYPSELSLAPALGRLLAESPETQLRARVTDWSRCQALLEEGAVDLALMELEEIKSSNVKPLNQSPVRLLARAGHPLAGRSDPSLEEVLSYRWAAPVLPARGGDSVGEASRAGVRDGASGHFVPTLTTPSLSAMVRCIQSTDMVGVLPLVLAEEHLERGTLELVRFLAPWLRLNYGLAWSATRPLPPQARRFMTLVEDEERRIQEREQVLSRRYGCDRWAT